MNIGVRGGVSQRNLRELADIKEQTPNAYVKPARIVGLTGGIASGKTEATDALRAAGFTVIDADEVSRKLTARGTLVEKELVEKFPAASDGGMLDRKKLRDLIASDKTAKRELEAYTHPLIIAEIKRLLSDPERAILSAPLLFETSLAYLCDYTVCIVCPRKDRVERLISRDGVTRPQAERIIDAQIPDEYRSTLADFCVPSDVPLSDFKKEIVELFTSIFFD